MFLMVYDCTPVTSATGKTTMIATNNREGKPATDITYNGLNQTSLNNSSIVTRATTKCLQIVNKH
jgi:hypothetical protein